MFFAMPLGLSFSIWAVWYCCAKNKAVPIAALMLPVITFFLVGPCYAVAKFGAPEVIFVYWMKAFAFFCLAQAGAVVFWMLCRAVSGHFDRIYAAEHPLPEDEVERLRKWWELRKAVRRARRRKERLARKKSEPHCD